MDTSGADEKYRLAIIQFLIMNVIIAFSFIFKTFIRILIAMLPFIFFLITILMGSRLTKEGTIAVIINGGCSSHHTCQKMKVDVKHFDPELTTYNIV